MPNKLQITQDGSHTILSEKYGVTYHSKYGAIQESMHVFIQAGLKDFVNKFQEIEDISILEIGFGTGLNAYLTLIETFQLNKINIKYTSLETFPISEKEVNELNYSTSLQQENTDLFKTLHDCNWESFQQIAPNFQLKKIKQSLEDFQPDHLFNLVFFDAFAPESQPELWEPAIFQKMYDCLSTNGILTTYCAKGQVKRNMKGVGFEVEGIPGPPGKREMTRARKN